MTISEGASSVLTETISLWRKSVISISVFGKKHEFVFTIDGRLNDVADRLLGRYPAMKRNVAEEYGMYQHLGE